ncbi:GAF and ANTAR domain-containing protein [Rhodococcus coprophilus]|uniref:RNA binding sensor regulator n=1 Tax=Rhodococcus coprophilus TaxID=38310 RepID=A0A2X4XGY5_9NOCA|nr:GAF and ANTAR domain-containing protein [Rhodococcus coprophilus]MBM7459389.1 GAF domain-containing protein [Rhodococcus coprophilus]SQI35914.1 RNA binding sensor regulator [Rhodococcus coprophilus]
MTAFDHDSLGRAMAAFARSLDSGGTDLESTLRHVTAAAVDLIPGADSADILTITGRKKFESHAATSRMPDEMDSLQAQLGEGPCVDAAHDALLIRSDDLTVESRWPRFAPAAVEAGVSSVLSFKLYAGNDQAGALNLFAGRPHVFGAESIHLGEVLAAHAAIAIVGAQRRQQLHSAIASRDLIGQAKGMLMERYAVDAERAFDMMVALSQESNVPVVEISRRIVDLGPEPR